MGCATQIGEQALNVGRVATLVAGWPETVAATTVDRQCGSSLQAAFNAAAAIQAGHLDVVVAAGVESMSRVPMGSSLGVEGFTGLNEKIAARWPIVNQGISAEEIAKEWDISREQLDAYALESHRRAIAAIDAGLFEQEIVPVALEGGRAVHRRRGSASRHIGREARGPQAGVPRGRRRDGRKLEPDRRRRRGDARRQRGRRRPGSGSCLGPDSPRSGSPGSTRSGCCTAIPLACAQALRRAGLGWDDIAVIEINEAFASVVLQTLADTGLHQRWESGDVNPERRRHLARSSTRRNGRADHGDAARGVDAAECALRPGVHVHRSGPGDRRRASSASSDSSRRARSRYAWRACAAPSRRGDV